MLSLSLVFGASLLNGKCSNWRTGWKLANLHMWQAPFGLVVGFELWHTPGLFLSCECLNGEHVEFYGRGWVADTVY
jgi:hypothetical protein